jgi:hypothetical protein
MAEVQVAVRFGRKTRADAGRVERSGELLRRRSGATRPAAQRVLAGGEVGFDEVADEVGAGECG